MAEIKAIETIYNGYRFRSRLEARWAVFFDAAGIEYQYEAEGYKLSNGMNYLPDFWLPQLDCWVEIKGEWPSDEDWLKMCFLANDSTYRVLLLGQIPISNNDLPDNYYGVKIYGFYPDGTLDYHDDSLCFCQCDLCEKWGFVYEGRIRQCGCRNTDRVYGNRDKVEDAYRKAGSFAMSSLLPGYLVYYPHKLLSVLFAILFSEPHNYCLFTESKLLCDSPQRNTVASCV